MINRREFERYLCNNYGCMPVQQGDFALRRTVGGQTYTASFGNHARRQVHRGEAQRFLQDLHFTQAQITAIMNHF